MLKTRTLKSLFASSVAGFSIAIALTPAAWSQDACVDGIGSNSLQCGDSANASGDLVRL